MFKATKTDKGVKVTITGTMSDILYEYATILEGLLRYDDLRLAVMDVTEHTIDVVRDELIKEKENR